MAPTAPIIRISAKPKKSVPVELLGTEYLVKPPKSSLLLAISAHADKKSGEAGALSNDFDNILKLMFSPKKGQLEAIRERLGDPEDDLDLDHIFETVEAITEEKTGNPSS